MSNMIVLDDDYQLISGTRLAAPVSIVTRTVLNTVVVEGIEGELVDGDDISGGLEDSDVLDGNLECE